MPVRLEVANLKVRSLDADFNAISWEIGDTDEDVLDYTFQVYRSESASGPFEAISDTLEDHYDFVDNNIPKANLYRQLHYSVRVTHKASGALKDVGPVSKEPEANLIVAEIRTHVNLLMREFAGRRCWAVPVRTFGQRCGACYNFVLQKKKRTGCTECFDTSYTRGYMRPIETWMQIDPSSNSETISAVGPTQSQNTTARLSYYPQLKPGDMVIEGENLRWRVVQANQTQHNRAPIHQEVSIHLIPSTDIEYKYQFELTAELKNLYLSPSRNFTNPQTLETAKDEELPDIFGIYPPAS